MGSADRLDADPERLAEGAERRLYDFADLVAQALSNADAYDKLAASRSRIVEAGDAERRRLERNLHDGAQQQLVSLAVQLRLVEARLEKDRRPPGRTLSTPASSWSRPSRSCASSPAASTPRS